MQRLKLDLRIFYIAFRNYSRCPRTFSPITSPEIGIPLLFRPVSVYTHTPLLETDFNLHKSNSTYFSGLDHSLVALATSLLSPGFHSLNSELDEEGHKGVLNIILGSVHTTFRREIKPYERYEIRSRVLSWDNKWIVAGTWFVRPGQGDGEDVILASALSKHVVKKGKYTVGPERCMRHAGLMPEKEKVNGHNNGNGYAERMFDSTSEDSVTEGQDGGSEKDELASIAVPGTLDLVASATQPVTAVQVGPPNSSHGQKNNSRDKIEKERLQGMGTVKSWLALDRLLLQEAVRTPCS